MEQLLWALGILVTVQIAVVGFIAKALWTHVVECRRVGETLAGMASDISRIKEDIGNHESGIRGRLHEIGGLVNEQELRIHMLEEKRRR